MIHSIPKPKRIESYSKAIRKKITQYTDRGIIYSEKNLFNGFIEFESLQEKGLFLLLDHDPNFIDKGSQLVKIPNDNKKGNPYIPDVWAKFNDGQQIFMMLSIKIF